MTLKILIKKGKIQVLIDLNLFRKKQIPSQQKHDNTLLTLVKNFVQTC